MEAGFYRFTARWPEHIVSVIVKADVLVLFSTRRQTHTTVLLS